MIKVNPKNHSCIVLVGEEGSAELTCPSSLFPESLTKFKNLRELETFNALRECWKPADYLFQERFESIEDIYLHMKSQSSSYPVSLFTLKIALHPQNKSKNRSLQGLPTDDATVFTRDGRYVNASEITRAGKNVHDLAIILVVRHIECAPRLKECTLYSNHFFMHIVAHLYSLSILPGTKYIAAQHPLKQTTFDFWKMVIFFSVSINSSK